MRKSNKYAQGTLLLWLVMATSACSAVSKELAEDVISLPDNTIETLYGFDIKADSLWFLVKSNGCTNESSFDLQLIPLNNNTSQVKLHRKKRDLCRGLTRLISINIPLMDKKVSENHFIVNNPFAFKPTRKKR